MIGLMKRKTIRNHKDFFVSPNSPKTITDFFIIKAKPVKLPGDARYGLVATKRTFKFATQRNRAKRLIRDWIAHSEDLMVDAMDYIFILRDRILNAKRDQGRAMMAIALNKILKAHRKNAKA